MTICVQGKSLDRIAAVARVLAGGQGNQVREQRFLIDALRGIGELISLVAAWVINVSLLLRSVVNQFDQYHGQPAAFARMIRAVGRPVKGQREERLTPRYLSAFMPEMDRFRGCEICIRQSFGYGTQQLSTNRVLSMAALIQPQHDLSPIEIDEIEERLYNHNCRAIGRSDGRGLGFVIRDEGGRIIGVAGGYSWAGTAELKQMWIDEAYRGRGYARELLNAFVAEAVSRGTRRIWVATYDFQAPEMYENAGFERMAEFAGWPEGHSNIVLCKTLIAR